MSITRIGSFRPWVKKVMPTVYDDTLTYYELLTKTIGYLNQVIDQGNETLDYIDVLKEAYEKDYKDFKIDFDKALQNQLEIIEQNHQEQLSEMKRLKTEFENAKLWIENEALPESIEATLNIWYDSGKLGAIINDEVFNMKADKTDLEKTDTLLSYIEKNVHTLEINVLYPPSPLIGAKGDGIENDSVALQNIINYVRDQGGGKIVFPKGKYYITSTLSVYSNIEIVGSGSSSVILKENGGYAFSLVGQIGNEKALATDRTTGDYFFTTVTDHDLQVGDLVLIKSQRNAFSDDAGEQWQLGGSTGGTNAAYFGEFLLVNDVGSVKTFSTASGLIYPDYFKDASRESNPSLSRGASTIQKVTPVTNAKISNLGIKGNLAGIVNVVYGYNVFTEKLDMYIEGEGSGIVFRESYNCMDRDSIMRYNPAFTPSDHYKRNPFKVISGQNCGFDGTYGEYATQTFDFTFNDYSIVTTFPFYKNGKTAFSDQNPGTSHGGVYGAIITNNEFLNCLKYGISTRSRNSMITGNTIQGSNHSTFSYGVALYEGHARDSIVSNNFISGFNKGVTILDGTASNKFFTWIGAQIFGNIFKEVNRGIIWELNDANKYVGKTGVVISNNTFASFWGNYAKGIILDKAHYVLVTNNKFYDPKKVANAGIYVVNGTRNSIVNNDFHNISLHLWVEPATMQEVLDHGWSIYFENKGYYTGSQVRLPEGIGVAQYQLGSINPRNDDEYSLGWSGGRWKTIWSSNGAISTSDERMKQQIGEIPDEWLDAWADVEYLRFKMNDAVNEKGEDEARWHIGVVAQRIKEVFDNRGIDATKIGLLCFDEWIDDETKEHREMWSIRADECHFLELALMRREIERLKNQ